MYTKKICKQPLWNSTYRTSYTGQNPLRPLVPPKKVKPYIPEHRQRYLEQMGKKSPLEHRAFVGFKMSESCYANHQMTTETCQLCEMPTQCDCPCGCCEV
uniref:Uncharacterized protein n=1 Tax=Anopheles dirus TaxID=7168 RepID=A0A182NYI3_9DIPT